MADFPSVLLVDDEKDILEFLQYNLKKEGFIVSTAENGAEAIELAKKKIPDLILLDIMMPDMDGIETCNEIRTHKMFDSTLIVFLTARNEDYSQVAGFEAGADDYITKPIRPRVLIARLKALLHRRARNNAEEKSNITTLGDLFIDTDRRFVSVKGEEVYLPKKEFQLLILFASKPGKIFSRDEIYFRIWGNDLVVGDRTLDVHIRKLREKIGISHIKTSKGIGYGIDF